MRKRMVAMLLSMIMSFSMVVSFTTTTFASPQQDEYYGYVAQLEAARDDYLVNAALYKTTSNSNLHSLAAEYEQYARNIDTDLGVAAALISGNMNDTRLVNARIAPYTGSAAQFTTFISDNGGGYGAAATYLRQGGIAGHSRSGITNGTLNWFFAYSSAINTTFTANSSGSILGSNLSQSNRFPRDGIDNLADFVKRDIDTSRIALEEMVRGFVNAAYDAEEGGWVGGIEDIVVDLVTTAVNDYIYDFIIGNLAGLIFEYGAPFVIDTLDSLLGGVLGSVIGGLDISSLLAPIANMIQDLLTSEVVDEIIKRTSARTIEELVAAILNINRDEGGQGSGKSREEITQDIVNLVYGLEEVIESDATGSFSLFGVNVSGSAYPLALTTDYARLIGSLSGWDLVQVPVIVGHNDSRRAVNPFWDIRNTRLSWSGLNPSVTYEVHGWQNRINTSVADGIGSLTNLLLGLLDMDFDLAGNITLSNLANTMVLYETGMNVIGFDYQGYIENELSGVLLENLQLSAFEVLNEFAADWINEFIDGYLGTVCEYIGCEDTVHGGRCYTNDDYSWAIVPAETDCYKYYLSPEDMFLTYSKKDGYVFDFNPMLNIITNRLALEANRHGVEPGMDRLAIALNSLMDRYLTFNKGSICAYTCDILCEPTKSSLFGDWDYHRVNCAPYYLNGSMLLTFDYDAATTDFGFDNFDFFDGFRFYGVRGVLLNRLQLEAYRQAVEPSVALAVMEINDALDSVFGPITEYQENYYLTTGMFAAMDFANVSFDFFDDFTFERILKTFENRLYYEANRHAISPGTDWLANEMNKSFDRVFNRFFGALTEEQKALYYLTGEMFVTFDPENPEFSFNPCLAVDTLESRLLFEAYRAKSTVILCAKTTLVTQLNDMFFDGRPVLNVNMGYDEIEETLVHRIAQMIENKLVNREKAVRQLMALRTVVRLTNMFTCAELDRVEALIDKLISCLKCIGDKATCVLVEEIKYPTQTEDGYRRVYCSLCGKEYEFEVLPKLAVACAHDNPTETIKPPTCLIDGLRLVVCEICGEELEREVLEATGHVPKTATDAAATCEEDGLLLIVCEICDEVIERTERPAVGHTPVTVTDAAATCEEDGLLLIVCEICGEVIERTERPAAGHAPVTVTDTAATCEEDGLLLIVCEICGEVIERTERPATGHDWDEAVEKEPTITEDGLKRFTCKHCGETYTESIPKSGQGEPVTVLRIQALSIETVSRGEVRRFEVELNPGASRETLIWTIADPTFAVLLDNDGTIFVLNRIGNTRLTVTDTVSGMSHSITLRIAS